MWSQNDCHTLYHPNLARARALSAAFFSLKFGLCESGLPAPSLVSHRFQKLTPRAAKATAFCN